MSNHFLLKMLLVISTARQVDLLTKIRNFKKDLVMNDKLCEFANLDFGLFRKVSICAAKCSEVGTCISFFYNKQTKLCKGATEMFSQLSTCQNAAYTGYYEDITSSTGMYGANCTLSPCVMDNSLCLRGVCSCQPGYMYESSTGFCVTDCSSYGDTYIGYLDMELDEGEIIRFNRVSLNACKAYCSERSDCRSFNYNNSNGLCKLKESTAYEHPEKFSNKTGVEYYNKNCV